MISQYWMKAYGPHGHVAMGLRLAGGAVIAGAVIAGTMAALASPAQAVTYEVTGWYASAPYQAAVGATDPVPFAHPFVGSGGAGLWTYPVDTIPGGVLGPDGPSGSFVLGPDPSIGPGPYGATYDQFFYAFDYAIITAMSTNQFERAFGLQDFQVSVGDFGGDADWVFLHGFDHDGNLIAQDYVYLAEDYTGFQRLMLSSPGAPGDLSIATIALFSLGPDPNSFYIDDFAFRMVMQTSFEPGEISPVPLPAGLPLLAGALGGLGLLRRKRRARA